MPPNFGNPTQTVIDIISRYDPSSVQQLRDDLHRTVQDMQQLAAVMASAGAPAKDMIRALSDMADRASILQRNLDAATNSIGLTGRQASGVMQAVMGFSRGLEDIVLTGGNIGSALNNVPELVAGLGRAAGLSSTAVAGLTAGLSVAASVAYLAYANWDHLMNALGQGRIKTEAEQMAELAKQTERTAAEAEKLLAFQERQATIKAQESGKSPAEKEQEKQVNAAVEGPDRTAILKGLADSNRDALIATDKDAREAEDELRRREAVLRAVLEAGPKGGSVTQQDVQDQRALDPIYQDLLVKRNEKLIAAAKNLAADAANSPDRLNALINAVERAPQSFPKGLADKLRSATPEGQEETKRIEAEMKAAEKAVGDRLHAMVRAAHDAIADGADDPAAAAREVRGILDELNRSGMVGQSVGRAREQLEDMARAADKSAGRADTRRTAADLTQAISRAMADRSQTPEGRERAIADALAAAQDGLKGDALEHVKDAATNARQQLGNRAMAAADDDIRDKLAEVRIADAASPEDRQAAIGRIRGQIQAARDRLGAELAEDLGRQAEALSRQVAKQGGRADASADRAVEAAAKKLAPGFESRIQRVMVENRQRAAAGRPVARTAAEFDDLDARGFAPAASPELEADDLRRRVEFDLRRAGGDPSLAGPVVRHAQQGLGTMMAAASARTASTMDGVVDEQAVLASVQAQVNQRLDRVEAKLAGVHAQNRSNRTTGRLPLQTPVRPSSR